MGKYYETEWSVDKNNKTWSNRFDSEDEAIEHMKEQSQLDPDAKWEVRVMAQHEINELNGGYYD